MTDYSGAAPGILQPTQAAPSSGSGVAGVLGQVAKSGGAIIGDYLQSSANQKSAAEQALHQSLASSAKAYQQRGPEVQQAYDNMLHSAASNYQPVAQALSQTYGGHNATPGSYQALDQLGSPFQELSPDEKAIYDTTLNPHMNATGTYGSPNGPQNYTPTGQMTGAISPTIAAVGQTRQNAIKNAKFFGNGTNLV